jgi:hypothetical protein
MSPGPRACRVNPFLRPELQPSLAEVWRGAPAAAELAAARAAAALADDLLRQFVATPELRALQAAAHERLARLEREEAP